MNSLSRISIVLLCACGLLVNQTSYAMQPAQQPTQEKKRPSYIETGIKSAAILLALLAAKKLRKEHAIAAFSLGGAAFIAAYKVLDDLLDDGEESHNL